MNLNRAKKTRARCSEGGQLCRGNNKQGLKNISATGGAVVNCHTLEKPEVTAEEGLIRRNEGNNSYVSDRQNVSPQTHWIHFIRPSKTQPGKKVAVCGKVGSGFQETTRATTKKGHLAPNLSCKTPPQETSTNQCLQPQTAAAALNQNQPQTAVHCIHSTPVASVGSVSFCDLCKLFSGFFLNL